LSKSVEITDGSDLYAHHNIELLDDDNDDQSHPEGELVPYIYSDSRVGTPRKYSSGIRISGFPGKPVFHGAVIPTKSKQNRIGPISSTARQPRLLDLLRFNWYPYAASRPECIGYKSFEMFSCDGHRERCWKLDVSYGQAPDPCDTATCIMD
jgi:hypothetical protein